MNRNAPAVSYELWNPTAAVRWSFLFSPVFGATLHAMNWRKIGEPRLARANMMWVWGTLVFLALNAATVVISLPKEVDILTRSSGIFLWAAWVWAQGRAQMNYVRDHGDDYIRKGWARPLLAAVLAVALYFAVCFALAYATLPGLPTSRDPATLAAWIEPRILDKWHENPKLRDVTIQKVVFDGADGDTYTGIVEATIGGKPERLGVKLVIGDDRFEWKLQDAPPKTDAVK